MTHKSVVLLGFSGLAVATKKSQRKRMNPKAVLFGWQSEARKNIDSPNNDLNKKTIRLLQQDRRMAYNEIAKF